MQLIEHLDSEIAGRHPARASPGAMRRQGGPIIVARPVRSNAARRTLFLRQPNGSGGLTT
jgi:hypothetical protein